MPATRCPRSRMTTRNPVLRSAGFPAPTSRRPRFTWRPTWATTIVATRVDRPAAPRDLQRHLGHGHGLPAERPLFLRLRPALRHELGRRPAQLGTTAPGWHRPPASGRHHRAAQRYRRRPHPPHRHPAEEAVQPLWPATIDGMLEVFNVFNHENYGSYTTQQSNRALRPAVVQRERGISAAHRAAGIPVRILSPSWKQVLDRGAQCESARPSL